MLPSSSCTGGVSNINQEKKASDNSQRKDKKIYLISGENEQFQTNEKEQVMLIIIVNVNNNLRRF